LIALKLRLARNQCKIEYNWQGSLRGGDSSQIVDDESGRENLIAS